MLEGSHGYGSIMTGALYQDSLRDDVLIFNLENSKASFSNNGLGSMCRPYRELGVCDLGLLIVLDGTLSLPCSESLPVPVRLAA